MCSTAARRRCSRADRLWEKVQLVSKDVLSPAGAEALRVLVGVSGGPDSTCLLHVLARMREDWDIVIAAAYVDHGMRERREIEEEIESVWAMARTLGVELIVETVPAGELKRLSERYGTSVEAEARKRRYEILLRNAERLRFDRVAVGHTLDDHVETILMRFFQGSGPVGLRGIRLRRADIIRPLLLCTRQEIREYLRECDIRYCTDSTNRDERFTRNAVRLRLLPVVEQIFPGFRGSLQSLASKMQLVTEYLTAEIDRLNIWAECPRGYRIDAESFLSLPGILRIQALFRLHNLLLKGETGISESRLPFRFLCPVLDDEHVRRRTTILRGRGIRLRRRGRFLFLEKDVVSSREKGYLVKVEKERGYRLKSTGLRFKLTPVGCGTGPEKGILLDRAHLREPLVVRSRRSGDEIAVGENSKLLKKLYNEWKVPHGTRWKIPVVADGHGIVGVFGEPFGFPNRLREGVLACRETLEASAVELSISRYPPVNRSRKA